jgi:hypothetical protein
MKHLHGR